LRPSSTPPATPIVAVATGITTFEIAFREPLPLRDGLGVAVGRLRLAACAREPVWLRERLWLREPPWDREPLGDDALRAEVLRAEAALDFCRAPVAGRLFGVD
jgi:hypothetical protein